MKAIDIGKAFTRDWVFRYGAPATILSDNGQKFTAKFLQSKCCDLESPPQLHVPLPAASP